ncbi:transposase family protein [Streptomyces mirabilis]|uniref:transposase family protein n=1 Tax=Streptomyces mirabilis TaxID=68239 RepID=UPI0033312FAE
MCRQSATVCLVKSPSRRHRAVGDLPSRLATLPDPRDRRGRRHPFVSVLLVACSAVMCGARSFGRSDSGRETLRRTPWPGSAPGPCPPSPFAPPRAPRRSDVRVGLLLPRASGQEYTVFPSEYATSPPFTTYARRISGVSSGMSPDT